MFIKLNNWQAIRTEWGAVASTSDGGWCLEGGEENEILKEEPGCYIGLDYKKNGLLKGGNMMQIWHDLIDLWQILEWQPLYFLPLCPLVFFLNKKKIRKFLTFILDVNI